MRSFLLLLSYSVLIFYCMVVQAYVNIALHKPSWLKNPVMIQYGYANLAVDGQKTNQLLGHDCTMFGNDKVETEWRVDLGSILSIHHIVIQLATNDNPWDITFAKKIKKEKYEENALTELYLGFSVYLSNTTDKEEGILCFRDNSYTRATIPNIVNISCPYHGRYYYNNRTHSPFPAEYAKYVFTFLCEVEVYGCPTPGVYGENCSLPCHRNCQQDRCDIVEGTCFGCILGFKGDRCNKTCDKRTYGLECKESCGNCKNGDQCNHVNGSCTNGCNAGVYGDKCDIDSSAEFYGYYCLQSCSNYCEIPNRCDRVTGQCSGECQSGWTGSKCKTVCDVGTFGHHCSETCGKCRGNEYYHHVNGSCSNGCDPGFYGLHSCSHKTYGLDCKETCGKCSNRTQCNHVHGSCPEGCSAGFHGYKCDMVCPPDWFGDNCAERCTVNCKGCNRLNGTCELGCNLGWNGSFCENRLCSERMFTDNCSEKCGYRSNLEWCHHLNGSCLNGCAEGYQGISCIKECDRGSFGKDCASTCGRCMDNKTCHHVNGSCMNGCEMVVKLVEEKLENHHE